MSVHAGFMAAAVSLAALLLAPGISAPAPVIGAAVAGAAVAVGAAPMLDLTQRDLVMAASGCGSERWAVKTGSDSDRNLVSTTQHPTTIAALRGLAKPSSYPSSNRIRPTELIEYVIAGTMTQYKVEADGDIHVIVKDSAGRSLIGEFPNTTCVVATRFKTEIGNARHVFVGRYPPTGSWKYTHRAIRLRGIGFFDYLHGQTGVAPNGIELHPVLGVGFP